MSHQTKRERKYAASYRAARISALNEMQDRGGNDAIGARQAKAKMNDTWTKRTSRNVTGFHKPPKVQA